MIEIVPLWLLFAVTVALVMLSVQAGTLLGRRRAARSEREREAPIGSIIGAILGLLAFTLAFTFGMSASRYDTRRQLVLEEANAVGTAYLRAGFLPEPQRAEIRDLLREYANLRAASNPDSPETQRAIARSEELHDALWSRATVLGERSPGSVATGLFIQSLNAVIDLHSKRVMAGTRSRVPEAIWVTLYFVTILAMGAVGYHSGLTGARSWPIIWMLALSFSAVILLIADLDRPQEGILKVSQAALHDLQDKLNKPSP